MNSPLKTSFALLTLLQVSWPATASAATQLPYFGPDQMNCGVAHPAAPHDKIDAGYVSSEDCSFVYVLPPKTGVFETLPIQYSAIASNVCTSYNSVVASILAIKEPVGTPEYYAAYLRALGQVSNLSEQLKTSFPGVNAYASSSAAFGWNGLIRAYQEANPHIRSSFVAMPVRIGFLSMASAVQPGSGIEEFANHDFDVRVSAYQPAGNGLGTSSELLPPYLSFIAEDKTSFLMGQSVGLELRFGIMGACGLSKKSNPEQVLSGTYTYVYPVQSKGLVRYEFKKELLVPVIKDFVLSRREAFTTDALLATIREKRAFNVVVNEGAFPNTGINGQLEDFKTELSAKATDIMLSLLATQSAVSLRGATWVETTTHSSRNCSGALFWKRCRTNTWVTRTTHVDWNRFANDLAANFTVPNVSAETYKTFYNIETSALVPQKSAGGAQ